MTINSNTFGIEIKLPILEKDHVSTIIDAKYQEGKGYARFKKGYCTDYVASKRKDIFPLQDGSERGLGGSAIQWYYNAQKVGIEIGVDPIIGAIAIFKKGQGASTEDGHVAIVERIVSDKMIEVTDMNYLGKNIITRRIIPSKKAIGYIYGRKNLESQLKYIPSTLIKNQDNLGKRGMYVIHITTTRDDKNAIDYYGISTSDQLINTIPLLLYSKYNKEQQKSLCYYGEENIAINRKESSTGRKRHLHKLSQKAIKISGNYKSTLDSILKDRSKRLIKKGLAPP